MNTQSVVFSREVVSGQGTFPTVIETEPNRRLFDIKNAYNSGAPQSRKQHRTKASKSMVMSEYMVSAGALLPSLCEGV